MKRISRRNFLKVAGVGAAALGLAACGGSKSGSTATSGSASSAAGSSTGSVNTAGFTVQYGPNPETRARMENLERRNNALQEIAGQVDELRRRVGMVFQKANPFPMSIYDNITYGPRLHGVHNKAELDELVESSLKGAALWNEVKDRLKKSALGLSGGQQQRLCIARALAVKPEVLLMDEPTSALDPGSTMKVEELMSELKKNYTVVIVTHNMQQAARISDRTAFFLLGELVEVGPTAQIFSAPQDKRTEDYISGRFG